MGKQHHSLCSSSVHHVDLDLQKYRLFSPKWGLNLLLRPFRLLIWGATLSLNSEQTGNTLALKKKIKGLSAWHHSHSAQNKSESQEAPRSSSVTSIKSPPPHISHNLQPWSRATVRTLAETAHTNLKTHTVTEILLTQEAWVRLEQLLQWVADWNKAH